MSKLHYILRKTTALIILAVVFLFATHAMAFDLNGFWQRPIDGGLSVDDSIENSLNPKDCAMCHEAQFNDWKGSRHSMSFSPGLVGQYGGDRSFAESCNYCHGPLVNQQRQLYDYDIGGYVENNNFNPVLEASGVSCAVCHVRNLKRYGPQPLKEISKTDLPHNGFVVKEFFSDSKFCATCHQFDPGDYKLKGKFMENTYNEWLDSKFAKTGITCQSCHMAGRGHEFKGIHDKDFVFKGLTFKSKKRFLRDNYYLEIKSTGVGHKFPTYSTPLVEIKSFIRLGDGSILKDSIMEEYIGWVIGLDVETEYMDTRLDPGESYIMKSQFGSFKNKITEGSRLFFEVRVYPDMFYKRFYDNMLSTESYSDKALIEEALKRAIGSSYLLYTTFHNL